MKAVDCFKHLIPRNIIANLQWRAKVHRLVLEDPKRADMFREMCSHDPIFFTSGFLFTHDTRKEPFSKLPFILYPYQEDMLLEVIHAVNSHDLLIEKSRDMGASWINLAAILWCWRFFANKSYLLGSRNWDYVDAPGNPKALLYRFDFMVDNLPVWLKPKGYTKSQNRSKGHLENPENGSVIDGESTTEHFASGDRRSAILLDEFSKVTNGYEILASTQPVTPCRLFNSTPLGIGNAFADLRGLPIKKIRLHWTLHPDKAKGLYNKEGGKYTAIDKEYWAAAENPEAEMQRLDQLITDRGVPLPDSKSRSPWYANECSRATSAQWIAQEYDIDYLGSGFQFFKVEAVEETIRKYARPPTLVGELEYDHQTGKPIKFRENPKGHLRIWFELDGSGKPKILANAGTSVGCDISTGKGASNSTACGWEGTTRSKLCEYVNPYIRPEEFALQVVALCTWLNNAHLIWEGNGPGDQFGARVLELGYGNIYYRQNDLSISGKVSTEPSWRPTREGKLILLGKYRDEIETGECLNYSKEALEECLEYIHGPEGGVYHVKSNDQNDPSGAKDNHGDRVIGDALAWKAITYRCSGPQKQAPEIPLGSLAWRNQQRERKKLTPHLELSEGWRR